MLCFPWKYDTFKMSQKGPSSKKTLTLLTRCSHKCLSSCSHLEQSLLALFTTILLSQLIIYYLVVAEHQDQLGFQEFKRMSTGTSSSFPSNSCFCPQIHNIIYRRGEGLKTDTILLWTMFRRPKLFLLCHLTGSGNYQQLSEENISLSKTKSCQVGFLNKT